MRVRVDDLRQAAVEILVGIGETEDNARIAADSLVRADMRGVGTHGTYLLQPIFTRARAGMLRIPTELKMIHDEKATALIDGQDGLGPVAAHEAMMTSVRKARDYGVGVTLVRNTNNVGFLGYYTELAAQQGSVGMMGTNAAASMAPWGGAEPFLGTNPISIAIPAGDELPIVVDMASSVVARGKIRKASRMGEQIPLDWALDVNGMPTTDPNEALKGTLLPIGGPKGSALALVVDIMAGMLSGSKYGPLIKTFHLLEGPTGVGAVCIAIDIERFMDPGHFKVLMDEYIQSAKSSRTASGFTEIFMPGEIEFRKEKECRDHGIELETQNFDKLNELLQEVGSEFRLGGEPR